MRAETYFGPGIVHSWEAVGDTLVVSVRFPSIEVMRSDLLYTDRRLRVTMNRLRICRDSPEDRGALVCACRSCTARILILQVG